VGALGRLSLREA
jgi:hypothetical protein